ncbi:hypothetical protein ARMSODRAFT_952849 [Armillaria solidipes]|uniref:Uncharacterized protein n=1 Tax=Armillaria solidipes TaxID=1076256 RepID=A0A2H3CEQ0_9AGAR|nr:hypothetical protein ARMSODRAFT_952849 [Armillaria solidipes]
MKRRHSDDYLPSPKRPRCNLEHTLSNLSLNNTFPPAPPSPPPAIDVSELPDDIIPVDAQLPDNVEEPIHDVKMKRSTWYEPEPDRIVVTDLDSSDDEDDEQDTALSISPALIDRIRSRQLVSSLPTPATHALVLYRPLPIIPTPEKSAEQQQAQPEPEPEPPIDDDAMDVEY